jgi:hypothetical protein
MSYPFPKAPKKEQGAAAHGNLRRSGVMKGLKYVRERVPRGVQALEFHAVQYAFGIGCISTCVMRPR